MAYGNRTFSTETANDDSPETLPANPTSISIHSWQTVPDCHFSTLDSPAFHCAIVPLVFHFPNATCHFQRKLVTANGTEQSAVIRRHFQPIAGKHSIPNGTAGNQPVTANGIFPRQNHPNVPVSSAAIRLPIQTDSNRRNSNGFDSAEFLTGFGFAVFPIDCGWTPPSWTGSRDAQANSRASELLPVFRCGCDFRGSSRNPSRILRCSAYGPCFAKLNINKRVKFCP